MYAATHLIVSAVYTGNQHDTFVNLEGGNHEYEANGVFTRWARENLAFGSNSTLSKMLARQSEVPDWFVDTLFMIDNGHRGDYTKIQVCVGFKPGGRIELFKASTETDITDGNANYSISGAEYGIYNSAADANNNTNAVQTITTNADGWAGSELLPFGTYYVKETKASPGYEIDDGVYSVQVTSSAYHRVKGPGNSDTLPEDAKTTTPPTILKTDEDTGRQIPQGDASLAGAVFTVKFYTDMNAEAHAATAVPERTWLFEVDADGNIAFDETHKVGGDELYRDKDSNVVIPLGAVSYQETKAPVGYNLPDPSPTGWFISNASGVDDKAVANDVMRGGFKIQKWDAELARTEPQGDGDYAGVHIVVYNRSAQPVVVEGVEYGVGEICYEFDLAADGTHSTDAYLLPYGTYELRETDGSDNGSYYENNAWTQTIHIRNEGDMIALTAQDEGPNDQVLRGGIAVQKFASEVSDGTVQQSQNGAFPELRLHSTFDKDEQAMSAMTLQDALVLAAGGADALTAEMFGMANNESQATASDPMAVAQAGAAFKGAELTVYNASKHSVNIEGKGVVAVGGVVAVLTLDENGYAATDARALPYGTYTLKETKAPAGYHLNTAWTKTVQVRDEGKIYEVGDLPEDETGFSGVDDQVIRGDYKFVKNAADSQNTLPFTPFLLVNLQSGENHVIVTNENGEFYSSSYIDGNPYNLHSNNTNANDDAITWLPDGTYEIDDAKLDAFAGVWFTGYGPLNDPDGVLCAYVEPNDALGALPYGDYALIELEANANSGYENVVRTFKISRNGFIINGGTMTDEWKGIELATRAYDAITGDGFGSVDAENGETTTLTDEVSFSAGLREGEEYVFTGVLMDRATSESIKADDGSEITAEARHVVTAEEAISGGVVEVVFEDVPVALLRGKATVVFEDLYDANGTWIAAHADIEDEGQTVYYPEIRTTATDGETGEHEALAEDGGTVRIVDVVEYSGLKAGETYVMDGTLMDGDTGEPIEGVEPVSVEFVAEACEGTVEVVFEVSADIVKGRETVVFEECSLEDRVVAVHADIDDEGQTVRYPAIGTTATDGTDGDKTFSGQQTVTLVDTVEYAGLTPSAEYVMIGTLYDKQSGAPVGGAEPVSQTFVASESGSGVVEMAFSLNVSALVGHDVVVFEDCYRDFDGDGEISESELVAQHADIDDEGQTVHVFDAGLADEMISEDPMMLSQTGDGRAGVALAAGAFAAAAFLTGAIIMHSRRSGRR